MNPSTRADLIRFAVLTALITGGLWLLLRLLGLDIGEGAGFWIFGLAAAGPSLAALILFLIGPRAPHQRVSAPWLWLPAAVVLGVVPTVLANLIVDPGSIAASLDRAPGVLAEFGGGIMFVVLFLVAGPLAEEFGWRGYVQPRLRRRFGIVATPVLLGLAWAVWHVPLYFLPGTGQYETGLFTVNGLVFIVTCIPLSLVFLFVSERLGGRVWAAILIHFSGNAIGGFLPSEALAVSLLQLAITTALAAGVLLAWGGRRGPAIERVAAREALSAARR